MLSMHLALTNEGLYSSVSVDSAVSGDFVPAWIPSVMLIMDLRNFYCPEVLFLNPIYLLTYFLLFYFEF